MDAASQRLRMRRKTLLVPVIKPFDEVETLDAAKDTFWELGYEAASIEDLTERTGLSRSSLCAAYGNKNQLFTKALERYLEQQSITRLDGLENSTDGVDAVRRYFAGICQTAEAGGTRFGCLSANTMAEIRLDGTPQRALLDRYRSRMIKAFEAALSRAAKPWPSSSRTPATRLPALGSGTWGMSRGASRPTRGSTNGGASANRAMRLRTPRIRSTRPMATCRRSAPPNGARLPSKQRTSTSKHAPSSIRA